MLLIIRTNGQRYAIKIEQIIEVVPMLNLHPIIQSYPELAGVFDYRGQVIPVIDLTQLLYAKKCLNYMSSRILVTHAASTNKNIGIMVDEVFHTLAEKDTCFHQVQPKTINAPYLGEIIADTSGLLQMINLTKLVDGQLPLS